MTSFAKMVMNFRSIRGQQQSASHSPKAFRTRRLIIRNAVELTYTNYLVQFENRPIAEELQESDRMEETLWRPVKGRRGQPGGKP